MKKIFVVMVVLLSLSVVGVGFAEEFTGSGRG